MFAYINKYIDTDSDIDICISLPDNPQFVFSHIGHIWLSADFCKWQQVCRLQGVECVWWLFILITFSGQMGQLQSIPYSFSPNNLVKSGNGTHIWKPHLVHSKFPDSSECLWRMSLEVHPMDTFVKVFAVFLGLHLTDGRWALLTTHLCSAMLLDPSWKRA
jgi:hypothetical protein